MIVTSYERPNTTTEEYDLKVCEVPLTDSIPSSARLYSNFILLLRLVTCPGITAKKEKKIQNTLTRERISAGE